MSLWIRPPLPLSHYRNNVPYFDSYAVNYFCAIVLTFTKVLDLFALWHVSWQNLNKRAANTTFPKKSCRRRLSIAQLAISICALSPNTKAAPEVLATTAFLLMSLGSLYRKNRFTAP